MCTSLQSHHRITLHNSPTHFVTLLKKTTTKKKQLTTRPIKIKGVRFDPDIPQTIRLEFAKSNTKVSKPKQQNNSSPPAAAPHPTLLHPLTGREYFDIFFFCFVSFHLLCDSTASPIHLYFFKHNSIGILSCLN